MTDEAPAAPAGEEKPRVTPEQVRAALSIPAPFSTKTIITAPGGGMHIRFTFLETHADENLGLDITEARVAVTMSVNDALALRDLITRFEQNNLAHIKVQIGPDGKPIILDTEEANG